MDLRAAPAVAPTCALLIGGALAVGLERLSIPGLVALLAAALALGRRPARLLAWGVAGALVTATAWVLPERRAAAIDPGRPVEVVGQVAGHWVARSGGHADSIDATEWVAPLRVRSLRQGPRVEGAGRELLLVVAAAAVPSGLGSVVRCRGQITFSEGVANDTPAGASARRARPGRLRVKSRLLLSVERGPGPIAALSGRLRQRVDRELRRPGIGAAFARALVLGDASGVPPRARRGLNRAGLVHLLSVSGFHVSLLAGVVLLAAAWLPRWLRFTAAALAVAVYLLLVGPLPATLRAGLMGLLALAALALGRPPQSANALAASAAALVLTRPRLLGDLGFQLTVAATAGLICLAPALARRWTAAAAGVTGSRPALRALVHALAATVAAQIVALPWALPVFALVTPLAPLWNLLAAPWTALALIAALGWTGLACASPVAAAATLPALDALMAPLTWPGELPAGWSWPLATSAGGAFALALGGFAAAWWPRRAGAPLLAAALALALLPRGGDPELLVLDVGQGDAILLRDRERALLVDGGGWPAGDLGLQVLVPALARQGVTRLDAVVMTHPDGDHCRGLVELASYLPIAEVWSGPGWEDAACARDLFTAPGPRRRVVWAGNRRRLGSWRLTVLHPLPGAAGDDNHRSMVLRAEARGSSFLLAADIAAPAEAELVTRYGAALRADALKVPHHGSRSSSSAAFLAAVRPRLALISAGRRNSYGHPAPAALERLAAAGGRVLRTDRDGLLRIRLLSKGRWRIEPPPRPL